MKCPYHTEKVVQVNQNTYEYDEDGYNTFHHHKLIEKKHLMECLKENCAAWEKGHCNYKGD